MPLKKSKAADKSYNVVMRSLKERLASLKKWPHTGDCSANAFAMAFAGFFHPKRRAVDLVQCYMCDLKLKGWKEDDAPLSDHREQSPDCRYILRQSYEFRLQTFYHTEWMHKKPFRAQPEELAKSGFCAKHPQDADNDYTECCVCGILIGDWEEDDIPWNEHCKRSPDCPYARNPSEVAVIEDDEEPTAQQVKEAVAAYESKDDSEQEAVKDAIPVRQTPMRAAKTKSISRLAETALVSNSSSLSSSTTCSTDHSTDTSPVKQKVGRKAKVKQQSSVKKNVINNNNKNRKLVDMEETEEAEDDIVGTSTDKRLPPKTYTSVNRRKRKLNLPPVAKVDKQTSTPPKPKPQDNFGDYSNKEQEEMEKNDAITTTTTTTANPQPQIQTRPQTNKRKRKMTKAAAVLIEKDSLSSDDEEAFDPPPEVYTRVLRSTTRKETAHRSVIPASMKVIINNVNNNMGSGKRRKNDNKDIISSNSNGENDTGGVVGLTHEIEKVFTSIKVRGGGNGKSKNNTNMTTSTTIVSNKQSKEEDNKGDLGMDLDLNSNSGSGSDSDFDTATRLKIQSPSLPPLVTKITAKVDRKKNNKVITEVKKDGVKRAKRGRPPKNSSNSDNNDLSEKAADKNTTNSKSKRINKKETATTTTTTTPTTSSSSINVDAESEMEGEIEDLEKQTEKLLTINDGDNHKKTIPKVGGTKKTRRVNKTKGVNNKENTPAVDAHLVQEAPTKMDVSESSTNKVRVNPKSNLNITSVTPTHVTKITNVACTAENENENKDAPSSLIENSISTAPTATTISQPQQECQVGLSTPTITTLNNNNKPGAVADEQHQHELMSLFQSYDAENTTIEYFLTSESSKQRKSIRSYGKQIIADIRLQATEKRRILQAMLTA